MSELKHQLMLNKERSWVPCYLKSEVDVAIAKLNAKIAEKDAEILKLKRALWVTRTAMAKFEKDRWDAFLDCGNKRNRKDPAWVKTGKLLEVSEWRKLWTDNERKCRAKAKQYEEDK